MARAVNRLSALFVKSCSKPGRHADGGGLYLSVSPDGTRKRWVFLYSMGGKQREMGLGAVSEVKLTEAREKAEEAKRLIKGGIDPIEDRQAAAKPVEKVKTFGEVADDYIKANAPGWRNSKHAAQWVMSLSRVRDDNGNLTEAGYCVSTRDKPVDQIDTEAVLGVLTPIWTELPETAARVRGRMEAVLDFARVKGLRTGENPARLRGHLDHLLPRRKKADRGHHAAMPFEDVPAFVAKLHLVRGVSAWELEFLILTAARSGEVREARWNEVDLKNKLWTVPATRMKGGREHRVPLCDRAVDLLRTVSALRPSENAEAALVFPGAKRSRPLSDMALTMLLRRNAEGESTVHDFRSAFRDWAGDRTSFPREVAEAALAHAVANEVEAAYRRGDALEKRRKMMEAWSGFIDRARHP